jgi:phosphomannomutase
MVNFSICGRQATQKQREEYNEWDKKNKERQEYCEAIKRLYVEYDATVGGQISIDIYPKGNDKSQVIDMIHGDITFFGDKCSKGGNDFSIAKKLKSMIGCKVHNVKGPDHTMKLLKKI